MHKQPTRQVGTGRQVGRGMIELHCNWSQACTCYSQQAELAVPSTSICWTAAVTAASPHYTGTQSTQTAAMALNAKHILITAAHHLCLLLLRQARLLGRLLLPPRLIQPQLAAVERLRQLTRTPLGGLQPAHATTPAASAAQQAGPTAGMGRGAGNSCCHSCTSWQRRAQVC